MSERFDLKRMLSEIADDEKVLRVKPVLLSQKEINAMREQILALRKKKELPS